MEQVLELKEHQELIEQHKLVSKSPLYTTQKPSKSFEFETNHSRPFLLRTPGLIIIVIALLLNLLVLASGPSMPPRRAYCCGAGGALQVNGRLVCANPSQSTCVDVKTGKNPRNSVTKPYKMLAVAEPFMGIVVSGIVAWGLISWFGVIEMVADLMNQFWL
jgi:hypothetical protein